MYDIGKMPKTIDLGYIGENKFRTIEIDMTKWMQKMPDGVASIVCILPGQTKADAYIADTTFDTETNVLTWQITAGDLGTIEGDGEMQIWLEEEENNSISKRGKSTRVKTKVYDAASDPTETVPAAQEAWLESMTALKTATVNAAGTASSAKDDAVLAKQAAEAAQTAAEAATVHQPTVGVNGNWYVWNQTAGEYQDTQIPASGDPTILINDSSTANNRAWSAYKVDTELNTVKNALTSLNTNAVQYVGSRTFHVGENLLTSETAFSGTGWSGSLANGFTHATGNTDPLVFAAETVNGQAYIIDYDFTGDIGGDNMFVAIGDMPKVDVYHGAIRPFVGIISDGGYLKISCKSTYTGTIKNLKIRPVLASGGTELTFECAEITNGQNPYEISSWHVVAIGRDVLSKNVNGTRTVAIGDRALEKIVTGHRNIAIGPYAMPFVTEGDCNVSIGADTLYNPSYNTGESKAYSNVAIGKGTMRNGELVQNNIAIGQGAMAANDINAEENVCIGRQAGYNTKKRNTFIGHRAGYYYNDDAGINNVCVGADAGFNAYHNGQNNVFIGAEARANVPGASASSIKTCNGSIAIGKGAKVTGSYQIVIGNQYHETVIIAGKTLVFNQDGTVTWE